MRITTTVTERKFNIRDISETEMEILYQLMNARDEYLSDLISDWDAFDRS